MKYSPFLLLLQVLIIITPAHAVQEENHDYFQVNRSLIRHGVQAVLMCNGLFTSHRTVEQVFAQELAYLKEPIGTAQGGDYLVEWDLKAVMVGKPDSGPVARAAFRKGIGCVIMAPDQDFDDIDLLPVLDLPPPDGDPATIPWPDGDLIEQQVLPANIDQAALDAASDWVFERESREQDTLSLLVLHRGQIIHELYAADLGLPTGLAPVRSMAHCAAG